MAEAAHDNQFDSQGRPLHRNLDEEFLRVDGHDIFKTPSANLAVAANPEGPPAFTRALRTLQWPRGFKITRVEPYEGRMNPTQWL